MADYTLMKLVNWLEGAACKCFYSFEDYMRIKTRFFTDEKKEIREQYLQDSKNLVKLCQDLYRMQLPYNNNNETKN